jgi:signal transduction histidine kinase
VGLVLAAGLPLLALSIGVVWWDARLERMAESVEMQRLAVATAVVVDSYVTKATLLIQSLALSPSLQEGDIDAFERHLRSVAATTGIVLLLSNRAGEQVLNSGAPHGAKLEFKAVPQVAERIVTGGKPDLSNVIIGPLAKRPIAGLAVPVPNGHPDAIIVAARLDPLQLIPMLPRPELWSGAFAVVYDGKGQPFASTAPANLPVPFLPDQANAAGTDAEWEAAEVMGFTATVEPVSGTSWHVALLVPRTVLAAKLSATVVTLLIYGSAVIALAALLAFLLGRLLVMDVRSLLSEAHMAEEGAVPPAVRSRVLEFGIMHETLGKAAVAVRETAFAKARAAGLAEMAAQLESRVSQRTAELEETTGRLLNAQDDERRRIARDMHDSTVQELIAASLHLRAMQRSVDGSSTQELEAAQSALDRAKEDLRTMAFLMQPPLLDECGIATALRVYAEGFGQRSGLEITVMAPDEDPVLPRALETALFRVAQEGLTNVHRHAKCTAGRIRLTVTALNVSLEIEDEGRGMPSGGRAPVGVGITGMRARVRQLGGDLTIVSDAEGTILRVTIPLQEAARSLSAA